MWWSMLSDQVACIYPHKPQLAEISFFQQVQDRSNVILSCHNTSSISVVFIGYIIQPIDVSSKGQLLRENRIKIAFFGIDLADRRGPGQEKECRL